MKDALYVLSVVVLSVLLARSCVTEKGYRDEAAVLRQEVFARDSMVRHNDSLVSILVRDNRTEKEITDSLRTELRLYALGRGVKPVVSTRIEVMPVSKTDTIFITGDDTLYHYVGQEQYYYPDPADWVIRHTLADIGAVKYSTWDFQTIQVDLLISETKAGLYEAALAGPGFIRVRNLQVNSLPVWDKSPEVRRDGFLVGAGAAWDWKEKHFIPTIQLGWRYRDHHFLATGWHQGAGLAYLRRIGKN